MEESGGKEHSQLRSGMPGAVHFPSWLLKTFIFTDLTYIYKGSLWAEEDPLETVVPTSAWQCSLLSKTPDLQHGVCNDGLIPDKTP